MLLTCPLLILFLSLYFAKKMIAPYGGKNRKRKSHYTIFIVGIVFEMNDGIDAM